MINLRKIDVLIISITILLLAELPAYAPPLGITAHADVNITATIADFDAGEKVTTNHTINWTADQNWKITIKQSGTQNLGKSNDLSYTKPQSDLLWKRSVDSIWTVITGTGVQVTTGSAGSGNFGMDYKFLLDWYADKPGTYSADLTYTISAN